MRRDGGSRRHDDRCAGTRTPTHARPRRTGSHQTDSNKPKKKEKTRGRCAARRTKHGREAPPRSLPPVAVCCFAGSSGSARVGGRDGSASRGKPSILPPSVRIDASDPRPFDWSEPGNLGSAQVTLPEISPPHGPLQCLGRIACREFHGPKSRAGPRVLAPVFGAGAEPCA
jgi:hypothetical protein